MSGIHFRIIHSGGKVRRQDANEITGTEVIIVEVGRGLMGVHLHCPFLYMLEILYKILF